MLTFISGLDNKSLTISGFPFATAIFIAVSLEKNNIKISFNIVFWNCICNIWFIILLNSMTFLISLNVY